MNQNPKVSTKNVVNKNVDKWKIGVINMVSINAINGAASQYQQMNQVNAIKPETKQELQALGINSQNIKILYLWEKTLLLNQK